MPIAFYTVELPRCPCCGKPATHQVHGSGNEIWVRAACKKHAEKRLLQLKAAHGKCSPLRVPDTEERRDDRRR